MRRLVSIVILVSAILGFSSVASASRIEVLTQPAVKGDTISALGTVLIEITAGSLKDDDTGIITLPEDFRFCNQDGSTMTPGDWKEKLNKDGLTVGNTKNYVKIPPRYGGNENGLYNEERPSLSVIQLDENEIMLKVITAPSVMEDSYLLVYLGAIYIDNNVGDIKLSIQAPSNSGFPFPDTNKVGRTGGKMVKVDITDTDDSVDPNDDKEGPTVDKPMPEKEETPTVDNKDLELSIGSLRAVVNAMPAQLDAAPYVNDKGFTMVPLRFISEALNTRVEWSPVLSQVNIYGKSSILMNIATGETYLNNSFYQLESSPEIIAPGRVFVPLRFVAETLGAEVEFDKSSRVITIKR